MRSTAEAQNALRQLGNHPDMDSGDVIVRLISPPEDRRYSTEQLLLTDVGLFVFEGQKAERLIPASNISEIFDVKESGAAAPVSS